jgi:CDP-glycerol glycerophosphotransferase (TagB/SpsB family)
MGFMEAKASKKRRLSLKIIGYLIFAGFYYIFRCFCSIKPKQVFCIMTHDGSKDGNVAVVIDYLKKQDNEYSFQFIKKEDRKRVKKPGIWKGKLSFFIVKPYYLATSAYVLLDNTFLPMAYIRFSKRVHVVQLWHGTGTIKRFGQDVNTGQLKKLEYLANSRITHLIVNSEQSKKEYTGSFGVKEDKVFVYGLPRTDLFFDERMKAERRKAFYKQHPELEGKKLVLYAPTLRDQELKQPRLALDTEKIIKELPKDYVVMLRLHPFVMEMYQRNEQYKQAIRENVISMSGYPDINTLLLVADYLITDYSSVIFEYCLLKKPMLFYAYDLEEFSDHGRGFYRNYREFVPGPIAETTEEIIELLKKDDFNLEAINSFIDSNYQYLDGKSTERLYLHIFKN